VRNAIAYEIERQTRLLEDGGQVTQVTMGWDEAAGITRPQRSKEEAHDYRYFPEPDLPPLALEAAWIEGVRQELPELPDVKRARFAADYGLSTYDAALLTEDRAVADYFEEVVRNAQPPVTAKLVANWVCGELFRMMRETGVPIQEVRIQPRDLARLIALVADSTLNQTAAKQVFSVMWQTGRAPDVLVQEFDLGQISDREQLATLVTRVLAENADAVASFRAGKETALRFLIGQVMRASRGKANPQLVEQLLRAQLSREQ
jgi:aspartyl-tRNA(Asn)/glutamyl-tRNA(Gln) amidotransferase subunit B